MLNHQLMHLLPPGIETEQDESGWIVVEEQLSLEYSDLLVLRVKDIELRLQHQE